MLRIIFKNKKKRPSFEIRRVVNLLLLTATALATSGKYVTSIPHCEKLKSTLTR